MNPFPDDFPNIRTLLAIHWLLEAAIVEIRLDIGIVGHEAEALNLWLVFCMKAQKQAPSFRMVGQPPVVGI